VLAAAKVGGILANSMYPAEFIYENLMIQSNIINWSQKTGLSGFCFSDPPVSTPSCLPSP